MGKDKKKGINGNVFKVAGAKSLKKTKAKPVILGLKNMKQRVAEIDKQLLEIKNSQIIRNDKKNSVTNGPKKKIEKSVTKEDVATTTEKVDAMEL